LVKVRIEQVGVGEIRLTEIHTVKFGIDQDSVFQSNTGKPTILKIGPSEARLFQARLGQIDPKEPGFAQIPSRQVNPRQVAVGEDQWLSLLQPFAIDLRDPNLVSPHPSFQFVPIHLIYFRRGRGKLA
jgi:hypothetical protein